MSKPVIPAKDFARILCPALGLEFNRVRRIVLDVSMDSIVIAYVELVGDSRLIDLAQTLEGVQIESRVASVYELPKKAVAA